MKLPSSRLAIRQMAGEALRSHHWESIVTLNAVLRPTSDVTDKS
jgi:hypothetical protein